MPGTRAWATALAAALLPGAASRGADAQAMHEHGVARLNIAIEGRRATVELLAPAEGVYGFEHEPRDAAERARRDAGLRLLAARADRLVRFDPALGCTVAAPKIEAGSGDEGHDDADEAHTGEHSEVRAEYVVTCRRRFTGTQLRFGVTSVFPTLRTVEVQLLSDEQQAGRRITDDRGALRLQAGP
jgi:hypothetical protein